MHRYRLSLALLLSCLCTSAVRGQSCGRWHLPGTPAQFFGCGNSGGHHAPMVLTPGCTPPRVPRVSTMPRCQRCSAANHSACDYAYIDQRAVGSPRGGFRYHASPATPLLDLPAAQQQPSFQHQQIVGHPTMIELQTIGRPTNRLEIGQRLFSPPAQPAVVDVRDPAQKQNAQLRLATKSSNAKKSPGPRIGPKPDSAASESENDSESETFLESSMPTADPEAAPNGEQDWLGF